jgi:restriction endonuclease S subunit
LNRNDAYRIQIPLPPLEMQRQIVDEIAAHQRIIDGARQVVEGWKPRFEIDDEWEMKKLGEICETIMTGPFGTSLHESDYVANGIPVINPMDIVEGAISTKKIKMVSPTTRERLKDFIVCEDDIIVGRRGEMGRCGIVTHNMNGWLCGTGSFLIRLKDGYLAKFMLLQISSPKVKSYLEQQAIGVTMKNLNQGILSSIPIAVPPLEVQREIVSRIEHERSLVEGNRELIKIYEEKIKKVIERVWEG